MTHNSKTLTKFKTGTFSCGCFVMPIYFEYRNKFNDSWFDGRGYFNFGMWHTMSQFINFVSVDYLDGCYHPSLDEINNPALYAFNVSQYMANNGSIANVDCIRRVDLVAGALLMQICLSVCDPSNFNITLNKFCQIFENPNGVNLDSNVDNNKNNNKDNNSNNDNSGNNSNNNSCDLTPIFKLISYNNDKLTFGHFLNVVGIRNFNISDRKTVDDVILLFDTILTLKEKISDDNNNDDGENYLQIENCKNRISDIRNKIGMLRNDWNNYKEFKIITIDDQHLNIFYQNLVDSMNEEVNSGIKFTKLNK